jgi:prepilin-type N-terminal cleavage/methylation domain-containing protein
MDSKENNYLSLHKQNGFSIIELLIVLPIVSIVVIVLISALFSQYATVLAETSRTELRASGQTILINLQDELLFTMAYGEELEGRLVDVNEPSGGWNYDTNPQTLIINEIALDSTRRDETRHIVRQRVNNCESSSITANPLAVNNTIYFVQPNSDFPYSNLFKRTITPTYDLCSIDINTGNPCTPTTTNCRSNAKQTSCPTNLVGTGNCTTEDSLLTDKVLDFRIKYFTEGNIETPIPSSAEKIEIELDLGDKVFGKEIDITVKHTIRKIN